MSMTEQELWAFEAIAHDVAENEALVPLMSAELTREARAVMANVRSEVLKLRASDHAVAFGFARDARVPTRMTPGTKRR